MRKIIRSLVVCIVAVFMFACLLPLHLLSAQADDTFDAHSYDPGAREQVDIEGESTWHILEERPLSEQIHEDYVTQLRSGMAERENGIEFTISRVEDYAAAANYLFTQAVTVHTGNPKEGDYLFWQVPDATRAVSDHLYTGYQIYEFYPDYLTDANQEAAVDAAVTALIESLGIRNKTDYVKVKAVYDWMMGNITLAETDESTSLDRTAYGALIEKNADSKGFALLFYRVMMELGMDTRIIHGSTPDHPTWFWNIIKLGDLYYYVDAARGAESGNHDGWFLNGSAEFIGHTAEDMYNTLEFSLAYECAKSAFEPGAEDLTGEDVFQGTFFDKRTITIVENETIKLEARVLPANDNPSLSWASSDPAIVYVDQEGNITGRAEGIAYVYAASSSGGKIARIKVTVEKVYPDSGTAYAIKVKTDDWTNWGDLIFVRSKKNYEIDTYDEIVDIWGNHYEGLILAKGAMIEGSRCKYNITSRPWADYEVAILRIYVAERQIIHPQVLNGWFFYHSNLMAFYGGGFDLSRAEAGSQLLGYCKNLKLVDFNGMYTAKEQSFDAWFQSCTALEEVDFTPLGPISVSALWKTFELCSSLKKVDLSNMDTSSAGNMARAFFGCSKLEEVKLGPHFTKWIDEAYLPAGDWTNLKITLTEKELYEQYPEHASEWAGTWMKYKEIPVTGLTLDPHSMTIATLDSAKLYAAAEPFGANQGMTWSSSNEKVATVDQEGNVKALTYGTATITAVSTSNKNAKDTCLVQTRFYDVNDTAKYYYKPVYWAADEGITRGYDNGVYFGPQRDCTRRELCIFLWRMMGKPSVSGTLPFIDTMKYSIASDSGRAILWCYKNNIVRGYNDGKFKPDDSITRKDTMIMLYRLAGKPAIKNAAMKFTDVKVQDYAILSDTYRSIIWGTENGITNGYSDGTFRPLDHCLREHIVTFIYRFDQKFN